MKGIFMLDLYVDSADRTLAEPLLRSGCFSGLTTNPTLLQAAGVCRQDLGKLVDWAVEAGATKVFLQSWGATADILVTHGRELRALGDMVIVKVPVTEHGIRAAARLESEGTPVLVTAVYNSAQALPAMAAGAAYIAPYFGRMGDAGRDGLQEIGRMQQAISASGSTTRILVASLREPSDALALAALGVRDLTMAPATWSKFFTDPLTEAAVEVFEKAAVAI
jgi:transaldolase